MSVLPFFFSNYLRPTRLLDQQFGLSLDPDDLINPIIDPGYLSSYLRNSAGYIRPWRTEISQRDVGSTLSVDKEKFQVNLDVQQFKPEEITVKLTGTNTITIEGKHDEKEDEHGYISRQFVRRYVLPENCDLGKIESKLSSDGVLIVTAPRTKVNESDCRNIPITETGETAKLKQKKEQKKEEEIES